MDNCTISIHSVHNNNTWIKDCLIKLGNMKLKAERGKICFNLISVKGHSKHNNLVTVQFNDNSPANFSKSPSTP